VEVVELGDQPHPLPHHGCPLVERRKARVGQDVVTALRPNPVRGPRRDDLPRPLQVAQRPVDLPDVHLAVREADLIELGLERVAMPAGGPDHGEHERLHPASVTAHRCPTAVDRLARLVESGRDRPELVRRNLHLVRGDLGIRAGSSRGRCPVSSRGIGGHGSARIAP